ncbi:MAG: hypothetical protein MO846_05765 [Candidatus Devosia symbiotica]|nr:hypothetical protein [Candidatus Devosia symbiotica]
MSAPDKIRAVEIEAPAAAAARAKLRRRRSIALAIALGLLVITFYALTIIRMGSALFDRTL